MANVPETITGINQIFDQFNVEFTFGVAPDHSEARMTVTAQTSNVGQPAIPANLNFGYAEDNSGNRVITVDNVEDMIQLILQHSYIIPNGSLTTLARTMPMLWPYHGEFYDNNSPSKPHYTRQLWAHSVQVVPAGSANGSVFAPGAPPNNGPSYIQGMNAVYPRLRQFVPSYLRQAFYSVNVDFAALDYPLIPDSNLGSDTVEDPNSNPHVFGREWLRNTRIRFNPYLDVIQLEGSQLQFVENPNPNPVAVPLGDGVTPVNFLNQPFPVPIMSKEKKGVITVEWFNVPADFVLTPPNSVDPSTGWSDAGLPRMFNRALGCVNTTTFLGCPPETLLLRDPPEFKSKPYGSYKQNFVYTYPWQYDISMKFIYFNPPTGVRPNPAGGAPQPLHAGHNVFAPRAQLYYLTCLRPPKVAGAGAINANCPPCFLPFDFRFLFAYAGTW